MSNANDIDANTLQPDDVQQGRYPIRTVSTMTGVNPITLRAWERRYNLICPTRTAKGHRLYSQQDIDTIYRITELLNQGIAIGQVKHILNNANDNLCTPHQEDHTTTQWLCYRQKMLNAISYFDETYLESLYQDVLATYPFDEAMQKLLLPLSNRLILRSNGESRKLGEIAEERFFNCFLRNKLAARYHHRIRTVTQQKFLGACLPFDCHETPLLLFALAAQSRGYEMVLLGANVPFMELPVVANRCCAQAIVLNATSMPCLNLIQQTLPRLTQAVDIPVFIFGQGTTQVRQEMLAANAVVLNDDYEHALQHIGGHLCRGF